jgi:hypothetical protein
VLEIIRGFLVYVTQTYRPLTPFLMELHMSIDGWRSGRDEEGWILREAEVNVSRDSGDESESEEPPAQRTIQPPGIVKDVHIMMADLEVLWMLTAAEDPHVAQGVSLEQSQHSVLLWGRFWKQFWLVHRFWGWSQI